jgi:hypothetical protein
VPVSCSGSWPLPGVNGSVGAEDELCGPGFDVVLVGVGTVDVRVGVLPDAVVVWPEEKTPPATNTVIRPMTAVIRPMTLVVVFNWGPGSLTSDCVGLFRP